MSLPKDYFARLPKKRMGAGVVFFDESRNVLIVKPIYKDHWTFPGGAVGQNESPRQAAVREVKEEVGLTCDIKRLLEVTYKFPEGEKDENLQWIFYGGVLTLNEIKNIKTDGAEITDFKFAKGEELDKLTKRKIAVKIIRYKEILDGGGAIYTENWEEIQGRSVRE
jgi:8-oxo-dGTP pyrophosphatase MutT (NUDIX family)